MSCNCNNSSVIQNGVNGQILDLAAFMSLIEDQIDYQFIQRVIQEITQSCALPLPLPATSIPPLILQAAQWFWLNDDYSVEEKYYCIPNEDVQKCGVNKQIKLPSQIMSVFGCHKATDSFRYGAMGDFSLERMVMNNSMITSGMGSTTKNIFGTGTGFTLQDITAALYEVETWLALFEVPLTYSYNEFSHILFIAGDLGYSDLILSTWLRVKLLDLYNNYYFFRYVVCLAKRSMLLIMGTFDFKMPGGVTVNHQAFRDLAEAEIQSIVDWVMNNHTADYFFNSNTI